MACICLTKVYVRQSIVVIRPFFAIQSYHAHMQGPSSDDNSQHHQPLERSSGCPVRRSTPRDRSPEWPIVICP